MKSLIPIVILSSILAGCATPQKETGNHSSLQYNWSESPDFGDLRKKIGWSENYSKNCDFDRPLKEMVDFMNKESWTDASNIGLAWLEQCPIDMRVHFYTGISLKEDGKEKEADDHFRWANGLMDSLVASGDGKSPETAYITISVAEEYDALYFFGLEKKSQSLVSGKVMCDMITATNEDGKEFSIYFNPSAHFARLAKILQ